MSTETTSTPTENARGGESIGSAGVSRESASFRADFLAGAKAISPILPAGATVGLVTGVAAASVGLSSLQATALSVVVYSPTVMLAAFALLESGAPTVVLVGASLVVALRFVVLSASIGSYFTRLSPRWRWVLAYFLWTPVYALSIERFDAVPATSRRGYYLGAAVPLWLTVQPALIAGVTYGVYVPARWQVDFVVPLAFVALLVRVVDDRPTAVAALVAGTLAVAGGPLPLNLGVVAAILGGAVAGLLLESPGEGG